MLRDYRGKCRVYLACGYTDLRKGIDGLALLVKEQFHLDPYEQSLFLFAAVARIVLKPSSLREMVFSCCTNAWRKTAINGHVQPMSYARLARRNTVG